MKGIESTIAPNCPRNLHGWEHPEHLCYFGKQYCEDPTNAPECWRKYNAELPASLMLPGEEP